MINTTVENQKVIIISKALADKDHKFSIINLEAIDNMAAALKTVTSTKLWLYLAKNQNNYTFALSRTDFCRWAGCSKPSYLNAVIDLIDKGYLVPKASNSNIYTFFEAPIDGQTPTEDDKIIVINEDKKREIENTEKPSILETCTGNDGNFAF